jgi:predicted dehydrogenase
MSNDQQVNFAILGTGMVAEFHQKAIEANAGNGANLAAVVHYDPERFEAIGEEFGVPCISQEEMLGRDDIDVVAICTPSGQHPEQAIAAARAGKHVLVEKPMAVDLEGADRMIEVCEEADVRLGVVFQRRVEPLFARIKDALDAGDFGELSTGVVTMPYYRGQDYYDQASWRGTWSLDGGGVLMNQGIHIIDLLVWYMGDPVEIKSFADTLYRDIEVEDTAAAALRFSNGSVATITATTTAEPGFPHRLEIYGTNGGFQVEGESAGRWTLVDSDRAQVEAPETAAAEGAGSGGDPGGIDITGHTNVVEDFVDAVQNDRAPMIDGEEGRRSLATILAVYDQAGLAVSR